MGSPVTMLNQISGALNKAKDRNNVYRMLSDSQLLDLFRNGNDDASFAEWYGRQKFKPEGIVGNQFNRGEWTYGQMDDAKSNHYLDAYNAIKNAKEVTDANHLADRAFKMRGLDRYRAEFGGHGVFGRSNVEGRMPMSTGNDIEAASMEDALMYNQANENFQNEERQREMSQLLNGPVKEAFFAEPVGKTKCGLRHTSDDIWNGLLKQAQEADDSKEGKFGLNLNTVSDNLGMSRSALYNRLKEVKQRLADKGILFNGED